MRRRGKGKKSFGVLLIHCIHIQTCIIYSAEETSENFALNGPSLYVLVLVLEYWMCAWRSRFFFLGGVF